MPSLEWVAPAVAGGELSDPTTTSAVKVEVVGWSMDDFEAFLSNRGGVCGGDPNPKVIES